MDEGTPWSLVVQDPGNPKTVKAGDKSGSCLTGDGQFVVTKSRRRGIPRIESSNGEEIMFALLF